MTTKLTKLVPLALLLCCACNNSNTEGQLAKLISERDSLQALAIRQDSIQTAIETYVKTIAIAIDSIKTQEQILTVTIDEEGHKLKRDDIKQNLDLLSDVIRRQKEKMAELESQLIYNQADSSSYYRTLVNHLYEIIDAKDNEITQMKVELERSRQTIKKLNTRVSNLMSDVEAISTHAKEQAETISMQQEIMNAQNEQLNIGYIKVGSRKELKQAGLLTKGIFSGSRLNVTSIDFSHFQQIDIRDITEITCNSWHPELLSAHPEGSYSFREDEGEKTTLVIKDPAQFWSIVNYIVIRL